MSEMVLRSHDARPVKPTVQRGRGTGRGRSGRRGRGGGRGRTVTGTLPPIVSMTSAGDASSALAVSEVASEFARVPVPSIILAAASDVVAASSVANTTQAATAALSTAPVSGAGGMSGVVGVVVVPDESGRAVEEEVIGGAQTDRVAEHGITASERDESSEVGRPAVSMRRRRPLADYEVSRLLAEVGNSLDDWDANLVRIYTEPTDVRRAWSACIKTSKDYNSAVDRLRLALLSVADERYANCSPAEKKSAIKRADARENRCASSTDPPISDTYWNDRARSLLGSGLREERVSRGISDRPVERSESREDPDSATLRDENESGMTEVSRREERKLPSGMRATVPMSSSFPVARSSLYQPNQPFVGIGSQYPMSQGFSQFPAFNQSPMAFRPPFAAPYGFGTGYGGGGYGMPAPYSLGPAGNFGFGGNRLYSDFQPMPMMPMYQPPREQQPRAVFPTRVERSPAASVFSDVGPKHGLPGPVRDIERRVEEMRADYADRHTFARPPVSEPMARPPVVSGAVARPPVTDVAGGSDVRERDIAGGRARVGAPPGLAPERRRASDASLVTYPPERAYLPEHVHERRMPDAHEIEMIRNQFSRLSIPAFDGRPESYAGWKLQFNSCILSVCSDVNMQLFLLDPPNFADWSDEDYMAYVGLARMVSAFMIKVLGAPLVAKLAFFENTTLMNPRGALDHMNCIHPAVIWRHLEQMYSNCSTVASMGYFAQLAQVSMSGRESIDDYIGRVSAILTRLNQTGQHVAENMACMYLIRGLPERHRHWFAQHHANDVETRWDPLTIELRNLFLWEENLVHAPRAEFPKKFKARAVSVKDQKPSGESKCSHCGKGRHTAESCWTLHPELRPSKGKKAKKKSSKKGDKGSGAKDNKPSGPKGKPKDWKGKQCSYCRSHTHNESECDKKKRDERKESGDDEVIATPVMVYTGRLQTQRKVDLDEFLIDSAAMRHMCNDLRRFKKLYRIAPCEVHGFSIDGRPTVIEHEGEILLEVDVGEGKRRKVLITQVLYAPTCGSNLISSMFLVKYRGYRATFKMVKGKAVWSGYWKDKLVLRAIEEEDRPVLCVKPLPVDAKATVKVSAVSVEAASGGSVLWGDMDQDEEISFEDYRDLKRRWKIVDPPTKVVANHVSVMASPIAVQNKEDLQMWHERLGHVSDKVLKETLRRYDVPLKEGLIVSADCEPCVRGKLVRAAHTRPTPVEAKEVLERIHFDTVGPIYPESYVQEYKYYQTIVDDYSRHVTVSLLRTRDEIPELMMDYIRFWQNHFHKVVRFARFDRAGENLDGRLLAFYQENGTAEERTGTDTPQQNGTVERMNRTLNDKARAMMARANAPQGLWAEAVMYAADIVNHIATKRLHWESPMHRWGGRRMNLARFHTFGCAMFVYDEGQPKSSKFTSKANEFVFVGLSHNAAGYRAFDTTTLAVNDGLINVRFIEQRFPFSGEEVVRLPMLYEPEPPPEVVPRGGVRRLRYIHAGFMIEPDPQSYEEAMRSSVKEEWVRAMDQEMESILRNGTYTLVDLPSGRKAISNKWVYKTKLDSQGMIDRRKARLVIRGFSQVSGLDFVDTFAPTPRFQTLRTVLTVAVQHSMRIRQLDVDSAYLNATLREDIYMHQPIGYADGTSKVCKLRKALYGLKQAAFEWNKTFSLIIKSFGLVQSAYDACLYTMTEEKRKMLVLIWVDDMIVVSSTVSLCDELIVKMSKTIKIKDLGVPKRLLGLDIRVLQCGTVELSQQLYVEELIHRYQLTNLKVANTPLAANTQLIMSTKEAPITTISDPRQVVLFQSMVGAISYLVQCTRPDLAYASGELCRFMSCPTEESLKAAKHVYRYLLATKEYRLVIRRSDALCLYGYSDADWSPSHHNCRSTSGFAIYLGTNLISWVSRQQSVIALSTMEAEFIALCELGKESAWLLSILHDIGIVIQLPMVVYVDNTAAISFANSTAFERKSRHIHMRYQFVKTMVKDGILDLVYVSSGDNVADVFTKCVSLAVLSKHIDALVRVKKQ